jgi:hypothetical protein
VKLGAITLQDAPWPQLVERWHRLEELGVETIWVADHLGHKGLEPGEPWFEEGSVAPGVFERAFAGSARRRRQLTKG